MFDGGDGDAMVNSVDDAVLASARAVESFEVKMEGLADSPGIAGERAIDELAAVATFSRVGPGPALEVGNYATS